LDFQVRRRDQADVELADHFEFAGDVHR
jgi:hypothetical protein